MELWVGVDAVSKKAVTVEEEALRIIKESGDKGILQAELRKILNIDSREGSRLILRLLRKGVIRRKEEMYNGRKTFRIFYVETVQPEGRLKIRPGLALHIPCFTCPFLDTCGRGSIYDPTRCPYLTAFIDQLKKELKTRKTQ